MLIIGENINIMSKTIGAAMKERNPKPIQELAERLVAAGADYLDLNIGPARKGGAELMEFVVKTVQEVVNVPLFLDTTNIEAIEAGLKVYDDSYGRPIINSIMARPDRMEALIPMAQKYGAGFVALLYGPEGLPRDENERGVLAAELMAAAEAAGCEPEYVFIDPVVIPVTSQQIELQGCTNFFAMLSDIAPGYSSTCGLSNVSNGAPNKLRPILNQTYLMILRKYGLKSAIADPLDEDLMKIARDEMQDIEQLVWSIVDGETVDPQSLSETELKYYKTARVLLNQALYSHSWLEL
ncbi:MAG TPA: dihydropteroate synthase [Proteobacteria bacterium]|nr:dihydropteroate synthase [Pseudomonadota bacterium]